MKKTSESSARWRDDVLLLAEQLVTELESLCVKGRKTDSRPMPVDLETALRTAKRLRHAIRESFGNEAIPWDSVMRSIAFLVDIVDKIHSFF